MSKPLHSEFDSIAALGQALATRQVSAREIAQSALEAIDANRDLNAFLHVDADLTLQQADAADGLLDKGQHHPLTGIPIAHKDLLVTQGWRTTAGSKMLENYTSPFDATIVQRLRDAGAVCLGKLNCDEFGMGSYNENSAFGPVQNPWDRKSAPGGSSGGSAAAVAAGLVIAATATDTGGSVREPAAMCGVSGIKPTYGAVSRFGLVASGSSMDTAGPIARNAQDLMLLLDAFSGFDPADATSQETCNEQPNRPGRIQADFNASRNAFDGYGSTPLQGLRIGVPGEYFGAAVSTEVIESVEAALQQFEALGAQRVRISLPHTSLTVPAYYVIAPAESSSNLSRFDGVHFGYRSTQYGDLSDMIRRTRSEAFGDEVKRRIMLGTHVLSHGYYDAYYVQAQRVRRLIANDFRDALGTQCDVIMGPVTPTVARQLGKKGSPTDDWKTDVHTVGASLAGLPAMAIPCGFTGQPALPIGLQIIGNYFHEGQLLAIADCYQNVTDWHQRTPEQH